MEEVPNLSRNASEVPRPHPILDEFNVLWRGDRWAALAPIEARLVTVMLERVGAVVTRRELGAAVWPNGMHAERAVDARLSRLRRRVAPLGLEIRNVRRRGLRLVVGELPSVEADAGGRGNQQPRV